MLNTLSVWKFSNVHLQELLYLKAQLFRPSLPKGAVLESRNGRFLPTGGRMQTDFQMPSRLGICNPMQSIVSSLIKFNYFDINTEDDNHFQVFSKEAIFSF